MKIINIVGARPNFMKIAPLMHEYQKHEGTDPLLVHTGQHCDEKITDPVLSTRISGLRFVSDFDLRA
jgi:UDP-N-acetylglucosamine 2-epimerase